MKHAIRSLRKYITRCLVALFLLCFTVFGGGLTSCENRETGERMRFLLDSLQQANRNYEEFTSDSLQLVLCRYFDRWGTSNERLKAHYLLGRAYHDMGEIPHALECYQQATEMADTTREDCDYCTLAAVYGQMGQLFHWQNLPDEELKAWQQYSHCSWKIKDTLEAICGYELSIGSAFLKSDTTAMLEITRKSYGLYKKYGYNEQAACVFSTAIHIYLENGQYKKAKPLMDIYEKESGQLHNNIVEKGHEIYYYQQGLYQLGINNLDSAERLFRKSALSGQPEAVCKGLLMLYERRGVTDSISKYAHLFAEANDEMHRAMRTETVEQITSLYNYSRHQRIAEQAEAKAEHEHYVIVFLSFILMLLVIITWLIYIGTKRRHQHQLTLMTKEYENVQEQLKYVEYNLQVIGTERDSIRNKLIAIEKKLSSLSKSDLEFSFRQTEIYKKFKEFSIYNIGHKTPCETDWTVLDTTINKYFKLFYAFINNSHKLSVNQYKLCQLIYLNFSEAEIGILMNKTPKQVNKLKTLVNNSLFNCNDAKTLRDNLYRQGR